MNGIVIEEHRKKNFFLGFLFHNNIPINNCIYVCTSESDRLCTCVSGVSVICNTKAGNTKHNNNTCG